MLRRIIRTLLIVTATVGSAVEPIYAEVIRYDFSGIVRTTFGTAPQAVGDLFSGSLLIDTNLLPTTEQGTGFRRFDGPVDLRVSFRSAATGQEYLNYVVPQTDLVVNNDVPYDAFRASVFDRAQPRVPVFGFYFTDRNGTALSSTDLPHSMDPRAFDDWRLFYGDYFRSDWRSGEGYSGQFNGLVTSLNGIEALTGRPEPAATPEPSTLLLTAIGLSVGFRCRRSGIAAGNVLGDQEP